MTYLCFGPFELDICTGELRREGLPLRINPQSARVLATLAGHSGALITREELRREIWSETAVDADAGINNAVSEVRRVLGDPVRGPVYIETLKRRGYRFIAPVREVEVAPRPAEIACESPATPRLLRAGNASWLLTLARSWKAVLFLLLAATALLAAWPDPSPGPGGKNTSRKSRLVVLPLVPLGSEQVEELVSDDLTKGLSLRLTQIAPERLNVVAYQPSTGSGGMSIGDLARKFDADYLLTGSVRSHRGELNTTIRLLRTCPTADLWSEVSYLWASEGASGRRGIGGQIIRSLSEALDSDSLAPCPPSGAFLDSPKSSRRSGRPLGINSLRSEIRRTQR